MTPPLSNPTEQKSRHPIKSRKRERDADVVAVTNNNKKKKLNVVAVKKPRRVQLNRSAQSYVIRVIFFQRHSRDFIPNLQT